MKCPVCYHETFDKENRCSYCGYLITDNTVIEKEKRNTFLHSISLIRIIIGITAMLIGGIPVMIHSFKSNIENSINHYGTYSIEEFNDMELDDFSINHAEKFILDFDQYLNNNEYNYSYESIVYYLKDDITCKLRYYIDSPDYYNHYYISILFDEQGIESKELRLSFSYKGQANQSFTYINEEHLDYITHYFDIKDCYKIVEEAYDSLDPNKVILYDEIKINNYTIIFSIQDQYANITIQ